MATSVILMALAAGVIVLAARKLPALYFKRRAG